MYSIDPTAHGQGQFGPFTPQTNKGVEEEISNKLGHGLTVHTASSNQMIQLRCDYLSATADVGANEHENVCKALLQITGDKEFAVTDFGARGGYRVNKSIRLENSARVTLQADPTDDKKGFLRLDLKSPAKVGPDGMEELDEVLSCYTPMGLDHFRGGMVTRCDAVLDLFGVELSDLLIATKHPRDTMSYVKRTTGKADTMYFGAPQSKDQICAYDKGAKEGLMVPCVRLEARNKNRMAWSALENMLNPFEKLVVTGAQPERPDGVDPEAWQLFLALYRLAGGNAAVTQLPKKRRKVYREAMKVATPEWWKPNSFWQAWPKLLAGLGLIGQSPVKQAA